MTKIAFIGLGNMGGPMAANLVGAGHEVRGFDLSQAALDSAAAAGIATAPDIETAVGGAEVVITMLPGGPQLLAAYEGGLLAAAADGALLIDCSTVDLQSSRRAHELAGAKGLASVDAPVSGGAVGAQAGTLAFMAGGETDAIARAQPLFDVMGKRTVHCGEAGAGQTAKMCNNMLLAISMIGTSEAFVLAESLGLSAQALYEVASASSGQCWSLTVNCPVAVEGGPESPATRDYRPGFATELMLKDLGLAADAAAGSACTELGTHALAHYRRYLEEGGAGTDFSGIIRWIRDRDPNSTPTNT